MDWDEEAARKAVSDFNGLFKELEAAYPECLKRVCSAWREGYLRCGHKRLGRILLGYSPEAACKVRAAKE
ncbi:MAG: hypothetical protein NTX71_00230 [Candidatus Aureabacteria bacterium]|nr:hypothetical protein [Candidatus Auribacterota bacterium]